MKIIKKKEDTLPSKMTSQRMGHREGSSRCSSADTSGSYPLVFPLNQRPPYPQVDALDTNATEKKKYIFIYNNIFEHSEDI